MSFMRRLQAAPRHGAGILLPKHKCNNCLKGKFWVFGVITGLCLWSSGCATGDSPVSPPAGGTPTDLVLQNVTVTTLKTYSAINSVTVGSNVVVATGGGATLVTRNGKFFFRNGVTVRGGAGLQTVKDPSLTKIQAGK